MSARPKLQLIKDTVVSQRIRCVRESSDWDVEEVGEAAAAPTLKEKSKKEMCFARL